MNLVLDRNIFTPTSTIGKLFINDKYFCYTLEDVIRNDGKKIQNETAIPFGKYEVIVSHSPKFNRLMPLLLNVPNFSGIRIHGGNKARDTSGCILIAEHLIDFYTIQGSMEKELTKLLLNNDGNHFIDIVANERVYK